MNRLFCLATLLSVLSIGNLRLAAADWAQFRGPEGRATSVDSNVPQTWSETKNLRWKVELPGAGSSSPIVSGDHVFVTCYSGYGLPKASGAELRALQRHLVAVDRPTGKIRWTKTIAAQLPEDSYQGYISEHGYASSTPVTDGQTVFSFFGKGGVVAFDFAGKQLWQTDVGKESSNRRWGSAASLVLYKDLVIVNAAEESRSIRALHKNTGKEVWNATATLLELAYGTPTVVSLKNGEQEIVIAAPGEAWGLFPDTGKLKWFAEHALTGNVCPSVVADEETLYVFGGFRSAGSFSMRAGGRKDVSKSHVDWTSRNSSYVATPVLHGKHLYWIDDRGQAYCLAAATGEIAYRERVPGLSSGRPVYASPVVVGERIYVTTRWNGTLVLPAKPEFKILAQNEFASDKTDFNATPAVSDQQLFLRSNQFLYCVEQKNN